MTPEGFVSIPGAQGFAATLQSLERACAARGITVFARIDHARAAGEAGLALRPTEVWILGNARAGTPLMAEHPRLAIDLPLRILIWQDDDGAVNLGYNDPGWIVQRHTGAPLPQVKAMQTALSEILRDAADEKT
ncbi:DUF302 domain-containing protein [bacterium]|nr:DUF302 domain-containing protein [bacterium]